MASLKNKRVEIFVFLLILIYAFLSLPSDLLQSGPDPVKVTYPYSYSVSTLDFSPDSNLLAIGYDQGYVRVWNLVEGEQIYNPEGIIEEDRLLRTLGRHDVTGIDTIKFSPDGRYLLSGGHITEYTMTDNDHVLRGEEERINAGEVKLWDVNSGQCLQSHYLKNNFVITAAFSHDSKSYAASFEDGNSGNGTTINIWSIETGEVLNSITTSDSMVASLVFSPDGNYLVASYSGNPRITFWDLESMAVARTIKTGNVVKYLDFSNDGNVLAGLTTRDGCIIIWETDTGNVLRKFTAFKGRTATMDLSSDGEYIAGIGDGQMAIWNVSSGEKILDISSLPQVGDSIKFTGFQFSPDTKYIASGVSTYSISPYSLSPDDYTRARASNVSFDLIFGLQGTNPVYLWDFQDIKEGEHVETFWDHQRKAPLFYMIFLWLPVILVSYLVVIVMAGIIRSRKKNN